MTGFKQRVDAVKCYTESIITHFIPGGKRDGVEYTMINSTRPDAKHGSFRVNLNSGMWSDFATNDSGSDVVSLMAYITGRTQSEALAELEEWIGTAPAKSAPAHRDKWVNIKEIPTEKLSKPFPHFQRGEPSEYWPVKTVNNELIGYICRFVDASGNKEDLPLTWCINTDDMTTKRWRYKGFSEPRPLIGAEHIKGAKKVVVVEGQKCVYALASIAENKMAVVSWTGGANAIHKTDFSPLDGLDVIFWPDNDDAGHKAMHAFFAGRNGRYVDVSDMPKGWDVADMIAGGASIADVIEFIRCRIKPYNRVSADIEEPAFDSLVEPSENIDTNSTNGTEQYGNLPFRMLGYDSGRYYYYPHSMKQVISLTASEHTGSNLVQLAPLSFWEMAYPGKTGGVRWHAVQDFLITSQMQVGVFYSGKIRGRGVWLDNGSDIVVHTGNKLIVNNEQKTFREYATSNIYEQLKAVQEPSRIPLTTAQSTTLLDICKMLKFEKPIYSHLLAGWCTIAPICGALDWRPHLWLSGQSGTGKTWVMVNIIRHIIGDHLFSVGSSSDAGIRQALKVDALPVIIDEFESNNIKGASRVQSMLELARQASSETGAQIYKGTISGKAQTFTIRSCFCFTSVGVAIKEHADETRVSILTLKKNYDKEHFEKLCKLTANTIVGEYPKQLIARTIGMIQTIKHNATVIAAAVSTQLKNARLGDQYGILLAGAYSLISDAEITAQQAIEYVASLEWDEAYDIIEHTDEAQCIDMILESKVRVGNEELTIAEMIEFIFGFCKRLRERHFEHNYQEEDVQRMIAHEYKQAISRHGISVCADINKGITDKKIVVADQHKELKKMLANTMYAESWKAVLSRIQGAKKTVSRFAGVSKRGVEIDMTNYFGDAK